MQPIVLEKVKVQIQKLLEDSDLDLIELATGRSGNRTVLRVLVDRKWGHGGAARQGIGGITLDEASDLNRKIGQQLETIDSLSEPYLLEVSSPGLDRPLKTIDDFRRARGDVVRVVTREPIDGENTYTGKIEAIDADAVTLMSKERGKVALKLEFIAKARRMIEI